MLETIAVVLIVLWLLGMVSAYTFGGAVHGLLVVALLILSCGFCNGPPCE